MIGISIMFLFHAQNSLFSHPVFPSASLSPSIMSLYISLSLSPSFRRLFKSSDRSQSMIGFCILSLNQILCSASSAAIPSKCVAPYLVHWTVLLYVGLIFLPIFVISVCLAHYLSGKYLSESPCKLLTTHSLSKSVFIESSASIKYFALQRCSYHPAA